MKKLLILVSLFLASTVAQAKTFKVTLTEDNTIAMSDYFYSSSVAKVVHQAKILDTKLPSKEPLYLIIDSGGGSIVAGLELIENLRNLDRPVRTITMFAASMGFQTVEGLGVRMIQRDGTLMSHKARGGFYGEFPGQLDSRYGFWLKKLKEIDKRTVRRTKGKHTLKSYENLIENEYWCTGKDCITQGFADVLVKARCDKSLAGTKKDTDWFFMEGKKVTLIWTKDKCPLNSGVLEFDFTVSDPFGREDLDNELTNDQIRKINEKVQELHKKKLDNVNKVVLKGY